MTARLLDLWGPALLLALAGGLYFGTALAIARAEGWL